MPAGDSDENAGDERDDGDAPAKPTPPEGFADGKVLKVVSTAGGHAVILSDENKERVVPIFIGQSQAMAIKLRLQRRRYSRPLTHDLLDAIITRLGGEITKVHIDAVKSGVFVGTVYVRDEDETHEVDARSSDAIALAVGNQVPIFVAESVFEKAGIPREDFEDGGGRRPRPFEESPEKKSPEQPPEESEESEEGQFF